MKKRLNQPYSGARPTVLVSCGVVGLTGGVVAGDNFMRCALWVSVVYNFGGALLFAFPSSPLSSPGLASGVKLG